MRFIPEPVRNMFIWLRSLVSHNRIATSFVMGLLFIILSKTTKSSILIGLPIIILGEFFRTLSSGYLKKDSSLCMGGPYSITRNPLYVANFILGLGFMVIANQPILLFLFVILFAFIYHSTAVEEEKKLEQRFETEFTAYMASVPRFFPRPWQWNNNGQLFDWSLVKKHKEYITWLGIVIVILVLIAKMVLLR